VIWVRPYLVVSVLSSSSHICLQKYEIKVTLTALSSTIVNHALQWKNYGHDANTCVSWGNYM
jgi:hypothetical protein